MGFKMTLRLRDGRTCITQGVGSLGLAAAAQFIESIATNEPHVQFTIQAPAGPDISACYFDITDATLEVAF